MKRIAVAGNPNSGKTCVFNNLTGSSQRVGNYPGVTVEFTEGTSQFGGEKVQIIDLPGTYSLTAYSQDEVVARDYIINEKPDVVVNVVDASNLERHMYLTTQLLELNVPVVLVLNMYDVAKKKGIVIDTELLSKTLGVKVVKAVAVKREGMDDIKAACLDTVINGIMPHPVSYPHELENILPPLVAAVKESSSITEKYNDMWFTIKLLEDDKIILDVLETIDGNQKIKDELKKAKEGIKVHSNEDTNTAVVEARYAFSAGAYRSALTASEEELKMTTHIIDSVACHKVLGPLALCGVVWSLFQFVFKLADEWTWIPLTGGEWVSPVGLFELGFEFLSNLGATISTPWLQSLVVDGIIGGVGGVMGFVPLIFFMFLFLSFLEDSGYIARVAFVLDRVLRTFGLQGKSILALIVSGGLGAGGCAVPGVMATRTMREEKDRLVTILVAPLMNCGAKLPVFAMLIAAFFSEHKGMMMFLIWALSWCFALLFAVVLRKFVIKGEQTPFVMELPLYHLPTLRGVLIDTWHRTYMYIKKAATIILAINVILWALIYYPRHDTSEFEALRSDASKTLISKMAQTKFAPLFTEDLYEQTLNGLNEETETDSKTFAELKEALQNESSPVTQAVIEFSDKSEEIDNNQQMTQFTGSFAGRVGMSLEPISKLAGFDWRDNIALIGGFAAKEVIVGYLGTVYSMGEVDPEETSSLAQRLQNAPNWSKLKAFSMILFIMIYAPCFVTVATIRKETNTKWALFSTGYTTFLGFVFAVIVFQVGNILFG